MEDNIRNLLQLDKERLDNEKKVLCLENFLIEKNVEKFSYLNEEIKNNIGQDLIFEYESYLGRICQKILNKNSVRICIVNIFQQKDSQFGFLGIYSDNPRRYSINDIQEVEDAICLGKIVEYYKENENKIREQNIELINDTKKERQKIEDLKKRHLDINLEIEKSIEPVSDLYIDKILKEGCPFPIFNLKKVDFGKRNDLNTKIELTGLSTSGEKLSMPIKIEKFKKLFRDEIFWQYRNDIMKDFEKIGLKIKIGKL